MMNFKPYAILIPLLLSGCMSKPPAEALPEPVPRDVSEPVVTSLETVNPYAVEEGEVSISAVGDIMVHESQWLSQKIGPDVYEFRDNFEQVKEIFASDDLSIANLETTINEEKAISTYPRFNSPDSLLDALRYAGFDLIGTANNHSMDTGMSGILSTIEELEERNLQYFGTQKDPDARKYLLKTIKGMKIGFAAFSTAYVYGDSVVINNIRSNGMEKHVNYMDLTSAVHAFNTLKPEIDAMKEEGAEFIILSLHWGIEYEKKANTYQKELAQMLIDEGVGLILGSHPHMIQEMEFLISSSDDHEGLVIYSMGNFLSNQRNEILNMTGTEDGVISRVILKRGSDNRIRIRTAQFIPTWINRTESGDCYTYEILPIGKDHSITAARFSAEEDRIRESLDNTLNAIQSTSVMQFDFIHD
ncbi:CapA family protein [Proteiniclasticum sp. C24MP]|uniref:CapA family protein n=1 Tax=Proteiniclasticum sp. C24MP TaxID=3374101 RepID=UPI00375453EA